MRNPGYKNFVRNVNNEARPLSYWYEKPYSSTATSVIDPHYEDVFMVSIPDTLFEFGVQVGKVKMSMIASSANQAFNRAKAMFGGVPVISDSPFVRIKPTEDQVISMYKDGASLTDITAEYKISTVTIMKILRDRNVQLRKGNGKEKRAEAS